ncbi:ABC transporter substrate-binding protein [Xenorhabdus ishibashii]|uniref:Ferrichrome ABC transporter lipoprotein n=1 Tax=Xenorhabdus ishibashii TaxID=1034471 RepID=A0A2D0KC87_9GAMM|nr:ABC transporter substrate-binding protein [Xenorhabdus ishibashii]PHM61048.1 ferrichrome ABC transporter lipoprotein [Xenorhabdus ishibashii]
MRSVITVILLCLMGTSAFAATRQVTDTMGREVVIPEKPQRIVVMSEPAIGLPLMELGVQPVGSYGRSEDGTYQLGADFVDTVLGEGYTKPQGISAGREIDLEKLYALKPDLIIGTEFDIDKVKQLSTVAPVYLQNFLSGKLNNFNIEENLARLTGREQNFQKRREMYLQRVAATRDLLPENPANKTYLPILITDQINVVGEATGFTQALEDLGFTRLNLSAQGGLSATSSQLLLQLSADKLGELNPDVLVVLNSWGSKEHDENAIRSALDRIVPGWAHYMKPAREKRIIFLNAGKVFTPTFASAEHTLRAVEEWAKTKQ